MSFSKGVETVFGALTGAMLFVFIVPLALLGLFLFVTGL